MEQSNAVISIGEMGDWLHSLPGYNLTEGTIFIQSLNSICQDLNGSMFWLGAVAPPALEINFAARETKEFTISVQPYSMLLSLAGSSNQTEGFNVSIQDKGSKTNLFHRGFVGNGVATLPVWDGGATQDIPIGPYYLTSPYMLTVPGQVQVQLTNLSPNAAIIQILMGFAVPMAGSEKTQIVKDPDKELDVTSIPYGSGHGNDGKPAIKKRLMDTMPIPTSN